MTQAETPRQGAVPHWTMADRFRKARESMSPVPTQDEFAILMEVDRNTVGNYETGRTTRPLKSILSRWALVTGVPREWLEADESPHPGGPDEGDVRRQGLEPRTRWLTAA